jgi:hypothetical protein
MIKGINSSSRYISVTGGSPSNPYISPGSAGAGMVRWNPNMNQLEVNDGNSWIAISMNYATVELTPDTESLLEWARQKREQDEKIASMCEKYPALQKAKDNYDLILNLIKDENENKV